MKSKVKKYLASKDCQEYTHLDKIFELYLNGNIDKILSSYDGVGIYPCLNKLGKNIQLNFNYNNIYVTIDFFEDKYNVVVYESGISAEECEKLFTDYDYQDDFNLEILIKNIDKTIKSHSKLKDTTNSKRKKKLYNILSLICYFIPIIVCGSVAIYGIANEKTIKVEPVFAIVFIAIPLVVGCIFDIKSKRIK